jgi:hypothetical protein
MKKLFAALALTALCACQASNPVAPKATTKAAPNHVANSRYILISGVWTCVEGCQQGEQ